MLSRKLASAANAFRRTFSSAVSTAGTDGSQDELRECERSRDGVPGDGVLRPEEWEDFGEGGKVLDLACLAGDCPSSLRGKSLKPRQSVGTVSNDFDRE